MISPGKNNDRAKLYFSIFTLLNQIGEEGINFLLKGSALCTI